MKSQEDGKVHFNNGLVLPVEAVRVISNKMIAFLRKDSIGAPGHLSRLHSTASDDSGRNFLSSVDKQVLFQAGLIADTQGGMTEAMRAVAAEAIVTDGGQKFELHPLDSEPIDLSYRQHKRESPKPSAWLRFKDPNTGKDRGKFKLE